MARKGELKMNRKDNIITIEEAQKLYEIMKYDMIYNDARALLHKVTKSNNILSCKKIEKTLYFKGFLHL